ncbi:unnamed protein product [Triticum turgidum subsp. durum]|uniref:Non-specific lipid-transfer protein n=1 Tax=Triticum turgidum subsp. durum TaxID=4567 RepID=A0A9R1AJP9_TRITD|nr:unnamed protein product [Triticum turgidum subsp. durum]
MARLNSKAVAAAVVLAAVVLMMAGREASAALSCGQVDSKLAPCVAYVTGRASSISKECCSGVQGLNGLARSSPDRKIACRCLKSLATSIKSINMGKVSGVPGKCGVSVPFPISMSTNCNKYVLIFRSTHPNACIFIFSRSRVVQILCIFPCGATP